MTPEQVKASVDKIRELVDDDGACTDLEFDLYETLLNSIAHGTCSNPAECAKEAVKTLDLDFNRWR